MNQINNFFKLFGWHVSNAVFFPSGIRTEILNEFVTIPVHANYSRILILIGFISVIILGEESSYYTNFYSLLFLNTSYFFAILPSEHCSQTPSI
jgi:hypothetical protein